VGSPSDITLLLDEWRNGRDDAFDELFAAAYGELRSLAASYMRRERPDHTLQTTALVNEAYVKLVGLENARPESRLHFFAVAAKIMRQILVDHARARGNEKRGGKAARVALDDAVAATPAPALDLLALDEALDRLAAFDERKGRVVELRFFGGMTIEETAEILGVSFNTAVRDWELARAWLYRELEGGGDGR
jgi:RNA polymerase sigma factor (TIGR02999 family)